MAKDFAFMFMPGDYLRDTQCLSEKTQVAYDRIMCEHMRNICISQSQLDFFAKRLNGEEKSELLRVVIKSDIGYYIEWVSESINKRRSYIESRRKNRGGKQEEDVIDISKSYVPHMEDEINKDKRGTGGKEKKQFIYNEFYDYQISLIPEYEKKYPDEKRCNGYRDFVDWLFNMGNSIEVDVLGNISSVKKTNLLKMEKQLTLVEFLKLKDKCDVLGIVFFDILKKMENWVLLKKNKTIYETALTFIGNKKSK